MPVWRPGWSYRWRPGRHWYHWHHYHYRPWAWATWGGVAAWIGWSSAPVYYEYYVRDGYVYGGDEQLGPVDQYAQQAETLAGEAGQPADTTEWMPLGVFAVVPSEDAEVEVLVQLAVSKEGTISGTFLNGPAGITLPLSGSVDKTTQRAAWQIGEEEPLVMETLLDGLTKDQSTVLMHFEGGVTESWWMFRVDQETAEQIQSTAAANTARGALVDAYEVLNRSLNDGWRKYLALPPEVFSGDEAPDVEALRKSLGHYDDVATNPTYAVVARYEGFAETHEALKSLVAELSKP